MTGRSAAPDPGLAAALTGAMLLAALLAGGCGGRRPAARSAAGDGLRIAAFRVGDGSGDDLAMSGRGRLSRVRTGQVLGTLHPDGRFVDARGCLRFTLQPDGTIIRDDGTLLPVALSPDGTLRHRQAEIDVQIRDDGAVLGVDSSLPGAVNEEVFAHVAGDVRVVRRAVLFTLAVADELMAE